MSVYLVKSANDSPNWAKVGFRVLGRILENLKIKNLIIIDDVSKIKDNSIVFVVFHKDFYELRKLYNRHTLTVIFISASSAQFITHRFYISLKEEAEVFTKSVFGKLYILAQTKHLHNLYKLKYKETDRIKIGYLGILMTDDLPEPKSFEEKQNSIFVLEKDNGLKSSGFIIYSLLRAATFNMFDSSFDVFYINPNFKSEEDLQYGIGIFHLLNKKPAKEYYDILNSCKVCVTASFEESMNYNILEAVQLGTNVVVPKLLPYTEYLTYASNLIKVSKDIHFYTRFNVNSFLFSVDAALKQKFDIKIREELYDIDFLSKNLVYKVKELGGYFGRG